ncbi:MAG: hypothetical protein AAF533_03980 [Acidobacteriota bacterium]
MPSVPDVVPEEALDYDEIYRRGGQNLGDEDFVLLKCAGCERIFLFESEVDTIYLEPDDLNVREPVFNAFTCPSCGHEFGSGPWWGPQAAAQVTWTDLAKSRWRWTTRRTRETRPET